MIHFTRTIICLFIVSLLASCHSTKSLSFAQELDHHRQAYKKDFLKDERSPFYGKAGELDYLRFYDGDPAYRVMATFTATPDAEPFDMATYSGVTKPYIKYGDLNFQIKDQAASLEVYKSLRLANIPAYKDHLFIPFKDLTSGEATYGGGRYIDILTTDIKDGKLLLDFNKCYNPWCAFSDGYSCPIPPQANHLELAIDAGEKNFGKEH